MKGDTMPCLRSGATGVCRFHENYQDYQGVRGEGPGGDSGQDGSLVHEQPAFAVESPGIAGEGAVGADHAVAGQD